MARITVAQHKFLAGMRKQSPKNRHLARLLELFTSSKVVNLINSIMAMRKIVGSDYDVIFYFRVSDLTVEPQLLLAVEATNESGKRYTQTWSPAWAAIPQEQIKEWYALCGDILNVD